jgi:arylsulfate sulfotransferase
LTNQPETTDGNFQIFAITTCSPHKTSEAPTTNLHRRRNFAGEVATIWQAQFFRTDPNNNRNQTMKALLFVAVFVLSASLPRLANATQADDTTITITGQNPGVTPFITQLTLSASDTSVIKSIQFTVAPKPGSVTRPLSGTYNRSYLIDRGYLLPPGTTINLPIYGLYDNFTNTVTLTYNFLDGSSKEDSTNITTAAFADPCGFKSPTVLQARTDSTSLSYDYVMLKESCSDFSPTILDTDGAVRWVGPAGHIPPYDSAFFDNAMYRTEGTSLYRLELDGTITFLHDYSDIGVTAFHHNIDLGKVGLICDVDTADQVEAVNIEVDAAGNVVKTWNLAEIISAAMVAGGDDPSQFVSSAPVDWFHNNATTYNRADDSVIISSRENFLICLDYETGAIKWIFGDPTKQWYLFPSLRQFALAVSPGTLPPIGQHAPSITYDQNLLVFDDGFQSANHIPPGDNRNYASPRKYRLNLETNLATEVWNYEMDQTILDPICSSVYEDAPFNYIIDYSFVGGFGAEANFAQLLGLDAAGNKIFYYQYPTTGCNEAFNTVPLHLESTSFPRVGPQPLNISTRGMISSGDNALIVGFIVTGNEDKKVVLRVLGPSLSGSGLSSPLEDPVLTLYDASGRVIASNDDWQSDPGAAEISADGLAPNDAVESATVQTLTPGAYTVVATGKAGASGIGLVEAYDVSPEADAHMANISARGSVGVGDDVLIVGVIVGDVDSATVVVRALGPSLAPVVSEVLSDPMLTIYDDNGVAIASNDNWGADVNAVDVEQNGLAPSFAAESALALRLPAGAYSAILAGVSGSTGIGLIEVYDLD